MNKTQKSFLESNVKAAHTLRREGNPELARRLDVINQFLKSDEISKALEWADAYNLPLDFILDMKDLFCGFQD